MSELSEMSEIKLVAPYTASCNNHQRILALLKQKPASFAGPVPVFKVPVRGDADVSAIIEENNRKLPEKSGVFSQAVSGDDTLTETGADGELTDAEAEKPPSSFVELGAFQPKNRLEQITTVFLQDFPALRPQHVATVFNMVAQCCSLENAKKFRFSVMAESINDTRGVFVRYPCVQMAQWAQTAFAKLLPGITAVFDENLGVLDSSVRLENDETASFTSIAAKIATVFANKKLYSHGSSRSGTEDLDEVMQYYKTYKVENSELVEVPKELKEVIVRDIIKFRAKVLTIEREARKKEIERERRKAKLRLTSIFEGIRASAMTKNDSSEKGKDMVLDTGAAAAAAAESSAPNPLDLLSDSEYESHVAAESAKNQETQYQAELAKLQTLETTEKTMLLERLHAARNYEQALIENKMAHMDEFKLAVDFDPSRTASFSSVVSNKFPLYYKNHGEYLRLRNLERTKEEATDAADREEEENSRVSVPVPVPAPVPVPSIISKPVSGDDKSAEISKTPTVVISSLSESNLAAIKEKIGSLIEEFLGIREDLLIDFIYDFVLEHNLAQGEELVTELQETLDEDSKTVVDQLHGFIASLQS